MRWCSPGRRAARPPDRRSCSAEAPAARLDATVRGRVQGVGFRYFVLREAMDLGLEGWVANTRDGSVRCVAEGPRDRLERAARAASRRVRRRRSSSDVSEAWMPADRRRSARSRCAAGPIRAIDGSPDHRRTGYGTAGLFLRRPVRSASLRDDGAQLCLPRSCLPSIAPCSTASPSSRLRDRLPGEQDPRRGDPHLLAGLG